MTPNLSALVQQRSVPGILVASPDGVVLFANEGIVRMLAALGFASLQAWAASEGIRERCRQALEGQPTCSTLQAQGSAGVPGTTCSLRVLPLAPLGEGTAPTHALLLLEQVVEKHQVDLEKARRTYDLSRREVDVLALIHHGHSNKKIADLLYLSEYTVKDHIKSLMRKLGAGSRSEILAFLR